MNNKKQSRKKSASKDTVRLNKYIAHAGICSRREADMHIGLGVVKVNNKVVTELGFQVKDGDVVHFDDKRITPEKKAYILLNKPKGFITTAKDERGRKTVMDLVAKATPSRIVPVGRLDRPTTGLLMFTNDGDLAKKLTHPSSMVKKLYHVVLTASLKPHDLAEIRRGLTLDDGPVKVDQVSYVHGASKREIGLEIHSGKNRIVRRIFEHLGYEVVSLDRVMFAGLTKKDLPRGTWRHLSSQEIGFLKMF
ncbi:MAG: rRNA pseudouridine synthase [Flavobacteriaceae bacterium]|jgi:23S rRNA pseudouridine2605 synthase|nr:rRNA pseudouridine synthase [Flavobacteriaceae bacterium]MDG0967536.1 pseudouridine synthase [Flavobacteriaceae bacterium]